VFSQRLIDVHAMQHQPLMFLQFFVLMDTHREDHLAGKTTAARLSLDTFVGSPANLAENGC